MMFVRKPTRSSIIDKAGCTQQFESELSLRSLAQLFPVKEGSFRKPTTSHLGLLPSGEKRKPLLLSLLTASLYGWRTIKGLRQFLRDGTALRYRYLYRSTAPFGIFIVNSIPTLPSFTTCLF